MPRSNAFEVLRQDPLHTRDEVLARPCPVPAIPGVYGWWFDEIPTGVPIQGCVARDGKHLLYVGISPKSPPNNGAAPSRQNLRTRLRYHYRGNAEGSTLRLTLGVLLAAELGVELRRVGSGNRRTFGAGEAALSEWMGANATVSWLSDTQPWITEHELIQSIDLPLNLADNRHHVFHAQLSDLRSEAKRRAGLLSIL